jgi:hypothetical protein
MKMKNLLSTAVLAMVALALALPALGQSLNGPGLGLHWQIALSSPTPRNSGTADYDTFRATAVPPATAGKFIRKFIVETITPDVADGGRLDVYVGPGTTANEPYGKLVGTIEVQGGVGAMMLISASVPVIEKGTTITVVGHGETPGAAENLVLKGSF